MDNSNSAIIGVPFIVVVVAVLIWAISFAIRSAHKRIENDRLLVKHIPRTASFPPVDGPGKYKVDGVDKESRMDTTIYVNAQSASAAKVKAELEGIVVVSCKKISMDKL